MAGILIGGFGTEVLYAQDRTVTAPRELDVGVYVSPPFVEETGADTYSGMAIDLWEAVAQRMGFTFRYVRYPTLRDLVRATANGEVDAAVTNLTITHDRARTIAFTQPWYDAGLRIMVPADSDGGFRASLPVSETPGTFVRTLGYSLPYSP
ncbi:MAG: transporter substrate-binding domain-containing protein [Longimicrobiales bacterium]